MEDQYAVIGNPIEHSKSPLIHRLFAEQTRQALTYDRILGNPEDFEGDVRRFLAQGGKGLNVTVPFKEPAWRLADRCSPRAETAQAVNTLILRPDGQLQGDNTDGIGLVRDLTDNHGCRLQGAQILLLGAGGAAKGVVRPLLETNPDRLVIANRTAGRALDLAARLQDLGEVTGCGLEQLQGMRFDLIINGTAAGLGGQLPDIPDGLLAPGGWTYDMMYASEPTAFVRWGRERGAAKALDGLGMLIEQAAESFFLWRGIRPDTGEVIRALR